jgi:hypothetical protein
MGFHVGPAVSQEEENRIACDATGNNSSIDRLNGLSGYLRKKCRET